MVAWTIWRPIRKQPGFSFYKGTFEDKDDILLVVKLKNPEVTERRPIDMSSNPTITVDIVGDDHQVLQFFVLVL
jgi:hypothetical protein